MELVRRDGQVFIENPGYLLTWVWRPTIAGKRSYFVMPAAQYEADAQLMDAASHALMKRFITSSRTLLDGKNKDVREYRFSTESGWVLR
jgi:hypothetical protein